MCNDQEGPCGAPCFGDQCTTDEYGQPLNKEGIGTQSNRDVYELSGLTCSVLPHEGKAFQTNKSAHTPCGADCSACFEDICGPATPGRAQGFTLNQTMVCSILHCFETKSSTPS